MNRVRVQPNRLAFSLVVRPKRGLHVLKCGGIVRFGSSVRSIANAEKINLYPDAEETEILTATDP